MENVSTPKYPVFIFPFSLEFIHEDPNAHKRLLAIYNPYDFRLKFRILSTASEKYTVIEPKGILASKSRIDIIIRHLKAHKKNYVGIVDKLRVEITNADTNEILGHRDIKLTLLEKKDVTNKSDETTGTYSEVESSGGDVRRRGISRRSRTDSIRRDDNAMIITQEQSLNIPNWVLLTLVFFCFLTLLLPVDNGSQETGVTSDVEVSSGSIFKDVVLQLYSKCTTTNTQKLVAAYILGIISCLIIKMQ
uniref:Major sperm protein n=1 Tax=Parastrongyloides trichosuri TaxID=131310 RepID=A0A0N4ZQN5_PARTI